MRVLGVSELPRALLAVWASSNGLQGDDYVFYSIEQAVEHNELLEVSEFAPGHVVIASDGGSRIAVLEANEAAEEVVLSYMGTLTTESMEPTGMLLHDWIEEGCPFGPDESQGYSPVEPAVVRLEKLAPGGLAELMRIRRSLNLDVSMAALKRSSERLPVDLCEMSYIRALRLAEELNQKGHCVSLWSARKPRNRLPLEWRF